MISRQEALQAMQRAVLDALEFAAAGQAEFMGSRLIQAAVIYKLQVIGEAVKALDSDFTEKHPDIPWGAFARLRDKLAHLLYGVNLDTVWLVLERELPRLAVRLSELTN